MNFSGKFTLALKPLFNTGAGIARPMLLGFACLVTANSFAQVPLDTLGKNVSSGTNEEKRDALLQIRNLGSEEAARFAIPALTDKDEIVRATAVSSVVFLAKDESARLLIPMLNDKAEFVRREAAFALGQVGSNSATSSLLALMQHDKSREVKAAAAAALGLVGDVAAVDGLISLLDKKPDENAEFIRRSAARSIGQIAQILANEKTALTIPQDYLSDKYKNIVRCSFNPISERFPVFRKATTTLIRVLQNGRESDDTRRESAFALGAIGDPSAISALRSNLSAPDNYLGEICKEALIRMSKQQ